MGFLIPAILFTLIYIFIFGDSKLLNKPSTVLGKVKSQSDWGKSHADY